MNTLLVLLVLGLCVSSSLAIQCYSCDSREDPECHKENAGNKVECDSRQCMKLVYDSNKRTRRKCAFLIDKPQVQEVCKVLVELGVDECKTCSEDLCNGGKGSNGSSNILSSMWMMMVPFLAFSLKKSYN